ncbi:MAG: L,D-transpeptidase family protein [Actinomycetota bacterium]|nr:L,D-transpeptidase family protein [Actinomycetota bacterium]
MPRGYKVLARALAGVAALAVVVQCAESPAPTVAPATTAPASTPRLTTAIVETSVPETAAPTTIAAPTTTAAPADSVVATTTSTILAPPTTTTVVAPVPDPTCPLTPHAAVIDRDRQRAWLCDRGVALPEFVVTTARTLPDPGTFAVYDKDMQASSTSGGHYSTMTHFVAFTRGENTGARVAFHTVPVLTNGEWAQPLDSVGTEELHGDSAGCIRVLPEQGQVVWDWLEIGDEVRVIT